jgi:acetyl-CoA synthetase
MMPDNAAPFIASRDLLLRLRTDYDAAVREFRWPAIDRFNWALDYFDHLPADDLALWCIGETEEKLTFGALQARSNQVANHLRELGVRHGDRVMLLLPNVRQLWEAMLALMKLGAVFSPSPTLLTETEIRDRFERGRMRHAIVDAALVGRLANLTGGFTRIAVGGAPGWHRFEDAYGARETFVPDGVPDSETGAGDPLVLYFTSGTTAKPKLVLHTHRSYPVGLLSAMYAYGLQPGDVCMGIAPPGWAAHVYGLFAVWSTPAAIVALAQPRFDANRVLELLRRCGVTLFGGPPTVWRMLVQQDMGSRPAQLREVLSGGEPLNPEVIEHVERVWGLTLRDIYGQTETTLTVGNSPGQAIVPGSMGRPMPGYNVKLLDENGAEAQEGEIAIALEPRPSGLLQGYQRDDGSVVPIEGRYYRTGDLARSGPDGRLTFIGRADDVFKSSDYRLSPFEMESALIEHEAVAEVAVVPSPDPQRLVVPKAFILLAAGHAPDRITAFDIFVQMRGRLAPYKRVRRIEFSEVLPKTISGKIRRAELRQQEEARRRDRVRSPAEFWEEDFPELAGRGPARSVT